MLYLVSTPIGNLKDFSFRAIETLRSSDLILCEDTRHSSLLLNHYEIKRPLLSYHSFNEKSREEEIIRKLLSGKTLSLISDAGTPGIADPGESLVRRCIEEGIQVSNIPGCCALITALVSSGFSTQPFQFCGFLPKKKMERTKFLKKAMTFEGTTLAYESPQRIKESLKAIDEIDPKREVAIARELSKKFEEQLKGSPQEILQILKDKTIKGEIVLIIAASSTPSVDWMQLSSIEHVEFLQQEYALSKKEAIKIAAELRGLPKKKIYSDLHH